MHLTETWGGDENVLAVVFLVMNMILKRGEAEETFVFVEVRDDRVVKTVWCMCLHACVYIVRVCVYVCVCVFACSIVLLLEGKSESGTKKHISYVSHHPKILPKPDQNHSTKYCSCHRVSGRPSSTSLKGIIPSKSCFPDY